MESGEDKEEEKEKDERGGKDERECGLEFFFNAFPFAWC